MNNLKKRKTSPKNQKKICQEKRKHILWTQEETSRLLEEINKKTPVRKISEILGKSEKAIRRKCEWLKISSSTTYRPRKTS